MPNKSQDELRDELVAILKGVRGDLTNIVNDAYDTWVEEVSPLIATYAVQAASGDAGAANRLLVLKTIAKQKAARVVIQSEQSAVQTLGAMVAVLAKFAVKLV